MLSIAESNRKLISLSRQGGIPLKDQLAQMKAKGGKPAPKMDKSASAPTLMGTKTSMKAGATNNARLGGGWSRSEVKFDLTQYKELLADITKCSTLDFCEKPYFRTALWEATWKNHEGIVKLLAAKGADIAAPDFQGRTPLHEAAYYGHANLVGFFIDKGHPMDCVDCFGQTPLFRAAEAGRTEVVKILVEKGANANLLDHHKVTAQHVSAFQGRHRLAEYLVENGAFQNRFGIAQERVPDLLPSERMRRDSKRKTSMSSIKSGAALVMTPQSPSKFPSALRP